MVVPSNNSHSMSGEILGTIVVPVLNESAGIDQCMQDLLAIAHNRWKVVVCDGGSQDGTLQRLAAYPVVVVSSGPGRARQMNAGAEMAEGPLLVFVHADTRLPADFNLLMEAFLATGLQWGRFDVQLDNPRWPYRMIAWFMNRRSALTGVCTGDQTFFMRAAFFLRLQGFAQLPLMEDVEFSLRARKLSVPFRVTQPVMTSARRWSKHGVLKTMLLMWWLRLAYRLGVSPRRLHAWYYG
ncbi:MAG: glycosyl transferase [Pseudomonadales bacterium]|nr:glycosyl transferase [Pseudomonadales bacterium]